MPALISWNTQGKGRSKLSGAYSELLSRNNDNIIMIQEFGNPNQFDSKLISNGSIIHTVDSFGRDFGEYHIFNVCLVEQINCENKRCTTALFIEDSYTILECGIFPVDRNIEGINFKRPALCCRCQRGNEQYIFGTVHLTAHDSVAAMQLNEIYWGFRGLYQRGEKWIIMGDFNCPPEKFDPNGLLNISHTNSATQWSGNKLDYAIFSDSLRGRIRVNKGGVRGNPIISGDSDHWPIHCTF